MKRRLWVIFFLLTLPVSALLGQERGDSLQRVRQVRQVLAERCANPRVVARERFSREDFFLYYPLPKGSWHASPNIFDPDGGYPLFLPEGEDLVYFSARDLSGSRSLFLSEERADSLWRAPRHPGEALLSRGTEVFPMLSPDRRTLYFASDGLPGMGGLDLFSCTWDDVNATWGEPVNMGIPINSPADDFLLCDTEDGHYTVFASNRSCGKDSVYVYVLEYEADPLRTPVHDQESLDRLLELVPSEGLAASGNISGNADTRLYMRKVAEMRSLQDSLNRRERDTSLVRSLQPIRDRIATVNREIRRIENRFLRRGSAGGPEDEDEEEEQKEFHFERHPMGRPLHFAVGEPDSNYFFEVADTGVLAPESVLPDGIIYQIFLFTSAQHAREEQFKGLLPVHERLNSNLRYSYYAGLFPTYRLALRQLNLVRKQGFPDARIVAYSDGRSIPVNQARQEE